jgi:hypothetical protein
VPEDHPPTHPECKLHDIDCDEVFPWGKVRAHAAWCLACAGPGRRVGVGDGPGGEDGWRGWVRFCRAEQVRGSTAATSRPDESAKGLRGAARGRACSRLRT